MTDLEYENEKRRVEQFKNLTYKLSSINDLLKALATDPLNVAINIKRDDCTIKHSCDKVSLSKTTIDKIYNLIVCDLKLQKIQSETKMNQI